MQLIARLQPQTGGTVTRIFGADDVAGITTYDKSLPPEGRPAQAGDVYSVQPDGSVQGRVSGTAGAYEVATQNGLTLLYRPVAWDDGPQFLFSLV